MNKLISIRLIALLILALAVPGVGSVYTAHAEDENHPPVWAPLSSQTVIVGQSLQFSVSATDEDNDSLTYSAPSLPPGAFFDFVSKAFLWTPNSGQLGSYTAIFRVTDGIDNTDLAVNITVKTDSTKNNAPIWSSIQNQQVKAGEKIIFSVFASDADNDILTYSASKLPPGASFNSFSKIFEWTPSITELGKHTISFKVSDGEVTIPMSLTITVDASTNFGKGNLNVTTIPNQVIFTGKNLSFFVNATGQINEKLSYEAFGLPTGATFNSVTREFDWSPGVDQAGNYLITFRISGILTYEDMLVTITVLDSPKPFKPAPTPPSSGSQVSAPPPAPTASPIEITKLEVKTQGDGQVIVSWKTNIDTISRVIYDTDSQADQTEDFTYKNATNETEEGTKKHAITINNVKTNTTYYLRAVSKAGDAMAISDERTFIQLPGSGAGLAGVFGTLAGLPISTWVIILIILALGTFLIIAYRRSQKTT